MSKPEFDFVAADYQQQHAASIRLSGESTEFFAEYKIADIAKVLTEVGCRVDDILDFGCGIGESLPHMRTHFPTAKVSGVDVSGESVARAKQRCGSFANLSVYDGAVLPFPDASFDVVFTSCVFHHISPNEHVGLMREIRRVTRPGGHFFLFEHNPWNPATRHAVANCPFDVNAILISAPKMQRRLREADFATVSTRYRLFFPNILRGLRPVEAALTWLPMGAQYYCWSRASG